MGNLKGTPKEAAKSLAIPEILMASGLLALTSKSQRMSDSKPKASDTELPVSHSVSGLLEDRIMIPSSSSPRPISPAEQHMPLEISPRNLRCAISIPSGNTLPTVATGIMSPISILNAPQQICVAFPSPKSTSTS